MPRLTSVIPAQQAAPMTIGFPPVRISFTMSLFKPIAAIAMTMKNRTMKPAQVALTAVMCGLPVVLVAFMLLTGALANVNMLLLSAALLALAAANFLLRTRFHGRAKRELNRMLENGRVNKNFFEQQTLTLDEKGVALSFPRVTSRYAWRDYAGMVERRETYLLYFGSEPAAIVPRSAFADEAEKQAFLHQELKKSVGKHTFSILRQIIV